MSKANNEPNPYEGWNWTPLFDDLPRGLKLADRAVYGQIKRRCDMSGKKSTASAATIASQIGTDVKTVERSLAKLEKYKLITCTFNGKSTRVPNHYLVNSRKLWLEKELEEFANAKTAKMRSASKKALPPICPETTPNLSSTTPKLGYKDTEETSTRYGEKDLKNNLDKVELPLEELSIKENQTTTPLYEVGTPFEKNTPVGKLDGANRTLPVQIRPATKSRQYEEADYYEAAE